MIAKVSGTSQTLAAMHPLNHVLKDSTTTQNEDAPGQEGTLYRQET